MPVYRSMISGPAIPPWPICSGSPSTPSRSTSRLCAPRRAARDRSFCGRSSRSRMILEWKSLRKAPRRTRMRRAEFPRNRNFDAHATDTDAVELYQLGCEYAQGFAFGEPMTADAARDLLIDKPTRLRALKIASE